MSLPKFPDSAPIKREDAVNQIISSIAMEELAISHIINAEGEKLQYILGTLDGATKPQPTIEQILEINESVRSVLQSAAENQTLLRSKLQSVLTSAVLVGPQGPPGTIEALGVQAELAGAGAVRIIPAGQNIVFSRISDEENQDISYNAQTGVFTVNKTGKAGFYLVNWWIMAEGSTGLNLTMALNVNGVPFSKVSTEFLQIQLSGFALIPVNNGPFEITLSNAGTSDIALSNSETQANITIVGFRAISE